jgi:transcriptional regulator with XRE-family HTH domain
MDQESVISDIERRAQRAGLSIRLLCERADVHPTTFSRWKRTERNPDPMGASLLAIGRLYDALDTIAAEQSGAARKAVRA